MMPASLRARSYLMSSPVSRVSKHGYERGAQDYLDHRVTDASFLSSYAMEEGYDTARKSRNRDAQLLRDATDAIVHSESFATPQASVAARRVVRGGSMVPFLRSTSVPPRSFYPGEAALIASKMDVESFGGRRRPRSDYAARKYRAMRMTDKEHIYMNSPQTSAYYASPPSGPRLTERKAIRTDDGYTKPKNLLSWQPQPAAGPRSKVLSKVVVRRPGMIGREQVITLPYDEVQKRSRFLGAPVKYFPSPYDFPDPRLNVLPRGLVTVSPLPKKHDDEDGDNGGAGERQRSSVKIPNYYACGVDPADPPMSDLRRRIRRTLNKTKRS